MSEKSKFPDPGILGLSAFVVSQALLNIPNTHLVPALATPLFVTVTLVFGGGIQLLCALFEYLRGNQFSMIIFWNLRRLLYITESIRPMGVKRNAEVR